MAANSNRDSGSVTQLAAMVGQLVRQNQTLIGHIDRVATAMADMGQDFRSQQAGVGKSLDQVRGEIVSVRTEIHDLRSDIHHQLHGLRSEMHGRFDAVGRRFDEAEERLTRLERAIHEVKLDLLRMENGILSAQQSALQAHLRMDEPPAAGQT